LAHLNAEPNVEGHRRHEGDDSRHQGELDCSGALLIVQKKP